MMGRLAPAPKWLLVMPGSLPSVSPSVASQLQAAGRDGDGRQAGLGRWRIGGVAGGGGAEPGGERQGTEREMKMRGM